MRDRALHTRCRHYVGSGPACARHRRAGQTIGTFLIGGAVTLRRFAAFAALAAFVRVAFAALIEVAFAALIEVALAAVVEVAIAALAGALAGVARVPAGLTAAVGGPGRIRLLADLDFV